MFEQGFRGINSLLFSPEIPPPASLQTQDGSAVARMETPPFFPLSFLFGPSGRGLCRNLFYLCKDDQPAPSKHPTVEVHISQQMGILKGGAKYDTHTNWSPPAQTLQHWCVFRNSNNPFFLLFFFVRYILDM